MMFGKSIRYYRLQAGLSQEELAHQVGVQKMTISNYERDSRTPSGEILEKICQAINIPVAMLLSFQNGPISISEGSFRKTDELTEKQRDFIISQTEEAANRYIAAASFIGLKKINTILPLTATPQLSSPGESAIHLRNILGLASSGPIANLLQVVENAGIVVIPITAETSNFSGYSTRCGDMITIIAFNKTMSPERQRFTIAHELVHLVFGIPSLSKEHERMVDDIAGRFLLPGIDIKRELGAKRKSVGIAELEIIHTEYGVSGQCVALRARQEGIITAGCYQTIADVSFVSGTQNERPTRLEQLVCRAYYEDEIGIGKVAELLKIPIVDARKMCGVEVSAEC